MQKTKPAINISKDQCRKQTRPSILARTSAKGKINNQHSQGPLQKARSTVNIRKDQCKKNKVDHQYLQGPVQKNKLNINISFGFNTKRAGPLAFHLFLILKDQNPLRGATKLFKYFSRPGRRSAGFPLLRK